MEFPGRKQGDQTMFHDPMQTYAQLGAYSPINPAAGLNPLTATPGISPQLGPQSFAGNPIYGGINPQQLHLAATLAAQTAISQLLGLPAVNPLQQMVGQQTPWAGGGLQNPLLAGIQQHPSAIAGLQHIARPLGRSSCVARVRKCAANKPQPKSNHNVIYPH
jgi:hypothetical protein